MRKCLFLYLALFFPAATTSAVAEPLNDIFPQNLSEANVQISFQVDSTWHLVVGTANSISGKVWLAEQSDINSIRAKLIVPTKHLDTNNSIRDAKLHDVMAAGNFPSLSFVVDKVADSCSLDTLGVGKSCSSTIEGRLTIRQTTQKLEIPIITTENESDFVLTGETRIKWAEFGVEDPSIFVAKLSDTVSISFAATIKK